MKKTFKTTALVTSVLGIAALTFVINSETGTQASKRVQLQLSEPVTAQSKSNPESSIVAQTSPQQSEVTSEQPQIQSLQEDSTTPADPVVEVDPEEALQKFISSGDPQGVIRVFAEQRKARAELVNAKMQDEQVDLDWSADIKQRIEIARNVIPQIASIEMSQVDCRNTICAIHFNYADSNYKQYAPYLQQVGIVLGSEAWVHHDAFPDGGIVYVARGDEELPKLKSL